MFDYSRLLCKKVRALRIWGVCVCVFFIFSGFLDSLVDTISRMSSGLFVTNLGFLSSLVT